MRELTENEIEAIEGGILPLLVVGAALLLGGCATDGKLRRGENPPE